MRLLEFLGLRNKAAPIGLTNPTRSSAWWPVVFEPSAGAWQQNRPLTRETSLTFHAVYACITLIAEDVSKCRPRIRQRDDFGRWTEVETPFSPVLRKPNDYQTRIKFFESWILSKLIYGNAYIIKQRDDRGGVAKGLVTKMFVLDPTRTRPLVAVDGSVWYELHRDDLSGVEQETIVVPASEIIHDVMSPLFHPLVGVSPLISCGLPAWNGLNIQQSSSKFFANGSRPSGILSTEHTIDDETAQKLKEAFETGYTGQNAGKIAILGDGLKFESMTMTAENSQLIEQLKITAEIVCGCFKVPPYKIAVGPMPANPNIEALNQEYYSTCLQKFFESMEALLDDGLGLRNVPGKTYETDFDTDDLLRMDTVSKVKAWSDLRKGGIATPNEARLPFNFPVLDGGDDVYLQQQEFGLAAHAKRDASDDPFATGNSASPSSSSDSADAAPADGQDAADAVDAQNSAQAERNRALASLMRLKFVDQYRRAA